jgi:hypothetical protein
MQQRSGRLGMIKEVLALPGARGAQLSRGQERKLPGSRFLTHSSKGKVKSCGERERCPDSPGFHWETADARLI